MERRRLKIGTWIAALGLWSVVFWTIERSLVPGPFAGEGGPGAAAVMARAVEALRACREAGGRPFDLRSDPNRTGLIGLESSPITTSLGQIEAKRTTTDPFFAEAVVRMFGEAGVRRGDVVAVGASSSFPGLILASLSAAKEMGLRPLVIVSLGASNWGANDPDWTWLEMADCLRKAGILEIRPIALSIGGEGDDGRDMSPEGREFLRRKIEATGLPFIREAGLESDVRERLRLFDEAAAGAEIKAFLNIGGSWVNMGTDGEVLKLKPGANLPDEVNLPAPERRGLIQEMALRGVPVIHLLYVRGLAERYGLPWDPIPLPSPGDARLVRSDRPAGVELAVLLVYLAGAAFLLAGATRSRAFPMS